MLKESWKAFMVMNFIAPKLSVEIVVGQGPWCVYTELTEGS